MEVTEQNLEALAGYLQQTLSPDYTERRAGEKFLESIERNQNYPLFLLQLIDQQSTPSHLRVSAAITLKNYVKRNWKITEDEGDKIHTSDRSLVKQNIVGLMLKSPEQIQKQLSDAISVIGKEDFPEKWPDLMQELVGKFSSGDFHLINGVLHTAHSLFKRYRHEFKSQQLWTEIKFVLDNFAKPLTELFNATFELSRVHADNREAVHIIYSSLLLISKIFYSLNFQDIPEFFEDNMAAWMDHFHTLLTTDNRLLITDDEEPGLMEQLRTQICDNITMYAQKYDEEFAPHLPRFVTAVWNLLTTLDGRVKYDMAVSVCYLPCMARHSIMLTLVSNAIQFLASVAERPCYKQLFDNMETLKSICENVVVPNMQFREADGETFEDNPEEYIRRDIEGSDVETRRRAACDLVRALCKLFESVVIETFSKYVELMLQEYAKNPAQNWKNKDAAIYLVTSLAAKGQTQKHGITQTSSLVNIVDFYKNYIEPDLRGQNVNELPVLKADAIKYVMIFRNQLPGELLVAAVSPLVQLLAAESQVVHSYAACCIEKLLTVNVPGATPGTTIIKKTDLAPISQQLLTNLFLVLSRPASQENEHVMKVFLHLVCWLPEKGLLTKIKNTLKIKQIQEFTNTLFEAIMRSLWTLQELFMPHVGIIVTALTDKLVAVSKNPSKPYFNHYLFESLCVAVSVTCTQNTSAVSSFEEGLFPPFQSILQNDVQEFMPYVFQVLSLLLEVSPSTQPISEPYMLLFPHLLTPVLWERQGNVPPLVRLLKAYIRRGWGQIGAEKLPPLLGVFQKLIASKANDQYAFSLLRTCLQSIPRETLSSYMQQILMLIFQRLTSSKTVKYVKNVLVFFGLFTVQYGASDLQSSIDQIQAKMFGMVIEKLFIADLQKISLTNERKLAAVGVTKILTECPAILQQPDYNRLWCPLLEALIGLFELPVDTSTNPDEAQLTSALAGSGDSMGLEEEGGFQVAYSQLTYGGQKAEVYCSDVACAKTFLAQCLQKLSTTQPGTMKQMVSSINPQAAQCLNQYLTAAGVQLV